MMIPIIQSKDNAKVKLVKHLLHQKKNRAQEKKAVLETAHYINELLQVKPESIHLILGTRKGLDRLTPEHRTSSSVPIVEIDDSLVSVLTHQKTSQEIWCVIHQPVFHCPDTFKSGIILDGVQNPSNVGAIIRSAAALGAEFIGCINKTADPFHPESLRAMGGAVFSVPFGPLSTEMVKHLVNTAQLYELNSHTGDSVKSITPSHPFILYIPSEMGQSDLKQMYPSARVQLLHIPMPGQVESLNVAVAAGICLSHIL